MIYITSKQKIIDDTGIVFDRHIARARLPYLLHTLAPLDPKNPFIKDYQRLEGRVRFINARDLVGDQLLILRLALRAYRVQNGIYPRTLNALTPDFLASIPADPFVAGESWRYQLNGVTYKLWSIGPDGRDDGGTPIGWQRSPRLGWENERVCPPRCPIRRAISSLEKISDNA